MFSRWAAKVEFPQAVKKAPIIEVAAININVVTTTLIPLRLRRCFLGQEEVMRTES